MGSSECWEQTPASATMQSNMQFAAKMPIVVAVIGFCPITRIIVAPTTKSGGTAKIASEANRRVPLARTRFRRCPHFGGTDSSRPRWKRRASPLAGWTPLEPRCPAPARSSMAGFASRLSFGRKSKERSRLSPTSCRHVAKERASSLLSLKTPAVEDRLVEELCKMGGQLGRSGRHA